MPVLDNDEIAATLDDVADLLEAQDADGFRVRAWRAAADSVRHAPHPLADLLERKGRSALEALPAVGKSIASAIVELVHTGRLAMLDRLSGQVSPEDLFTTLPGVGDELARRLHDELGAETLEDVEVAAHDGRLEALHGFGPRRARALRDALELRLARSTRRRARRVAKRESSPPQAPPSVALLCALDKEYRARAAAGELRTIAPRRFNPNAEKWLPVMHVARQGWHVTALFSNTARAHELGTTRDWVVLFFERDGHEDQCTIVTETHGELAGRRVVRGREAECRELYAQSPSPSAAGG